MSYSAESYEHYMVPALFAPWSRSLIGVANVQPGERVLDVVCGTGIVARHIAPRVGAQGRVVGLDLNSGMLNTGRAAASREAVAIEWCRGQAEQLPFPDDSFDLVVCQFGLMFFADRHAALTEMRRALRPGGRVMLSAWEGLDRHPFYQTLHEVSRRHLGRSSVETVFSLGDLAELRNWLTGASFQQVEIEPKSITARFPSPQEFLAWEIDVAPADVPALRHLDTQAQQAILAALHQDMQPPLREVMQGEEAVITFHAHIALGRR